MPEDFDLDAALARLDTSTRTLVQVRPAEEIRVRGTRRHRTRVGALSAAAAVAVVAVVAGYVSSGTSTHRSAPPATHSSPTPTTTVKVADVPDTVLLAAKDLPKLEGGAWSAPTSRDEASISDPPHSCASSTQTALGATAARQRDWAYVTPGGSGTHYREVVGSYPSISAATTAWRALATMLAAPCTPRGLQNPQVMAIDTVQLLSPEGVPGPEAGLTQISGATSATDGRFEMVALGRRANAIVVLVLTTTGQDNNLDPSVYGNSALVALGQLGIYGDDPT
jgi:hypothetical protein